MPIDKEAKQRIKILIYINLYIIKAFRINKQLTIKGNQSDTGYKQKKIINIYANNYICKFRLQ